MKRRIDLHIHTNISDGILSPEEVIDEAVKNQVHDTTEAYSDALFDYAEKRCYAGKWCRDIYKI